MKTHRVYAIVPLSITLCDRQLTSQDRVPINIDNQSINVHAGERLNLLNESELIAESRPLLLGDTLQMDY